MKRIVFHTGIIMIIFLTGLLVIFKYLEFYTRKNSLIVVPRMEGKNADQVTVTTSGNLKFKIRDSIYDKTKPRGVIVSQDPRQGQQVKPGRTVYLTINRKKSLQLPVPLLKDVTPAMGIRLLRDRGFEAGRIDTTDHEIPVIVGAYFQGRKLSEGEHLEEGSKIDLKIGRETSGQ